MPCGKSLRQGRRCVAGPFSRRHDSSQQGCAGARGAATEASTTVSPISCNISRQRAALTQRKLTHQPRSQALQPRSNLAVSSCNAESLCAGLCKAGNASLRPGGQALSLYPVLGQKAVHTPFASRPASMYQGSIYGPRPWIRARGQEVDEAHVCCSGGTWFSI